jgi:hypothetical protein
MSVLQTTIGVYGAAFSPEAVGLVSSMRGDACRRIRILPTKVRDYGDIHAFREILFRYRPRLSTCFCVI